MTRKRKPRMEVRKLGFLVLSSLVVLFSASGMVGAKLLPKVSHDSTYRYLSLFDEVLGLIRFNYVEPVDTGRLMQGAYRGAAEALDPGGAYLSPDELKAERRKSEGPIGSLGLHVSKRYGYVVVVASIAESPAAKAGIESGDYIVTIDGVSASQMSVLEAIRRFHGPIGSSIQLSVIRRSSRTGQPEDIELTRELSREQVASVRNLGTLIEARIPEVTRGNVRRVAAAVAAANEVGCLLLDFRGCSNDALDEAVRLADLFLEAEPIVTIRDSRTGELTRMGTFPQPFAGTSVYLLVDRGTAGAAEVVAGALKDQGRAEVLGERTFGRGSVQETFLLRNGGGLRVTVARYLSPSGAVIDGLGIVPDVRLRLLSKPVAGEDSMLDQAIDYIRGTHASDQKTA